MAHVFDYSASTTGLGGSHNLSNLFGIYSGTFLPAEFWTPLGTLQGVISYLYDDYDSAGNPVATEGSFRMHLDGWGGYLSQQLSPAAEAYLPRFWSGDPDIDASQAFFTGAAQLTLFSFYTGYLRIEGLPTLSRSFGPLPSATFPDIYLANEFVSGAIEAANANHLARLQPILPATLASGGPIISENFGPDPVAGSVRLVYTPDPTTQITFGDWIQLDPSGTRDGYTAQLEDTRRLFADEDVTIMLTDGDDRFFDTGTGFAARNLRIEAGAGNDTISLLGDDYGAPASFGSVPLHIYVDGGPGDDWIEVRVKGTATLIGGAGNDTIIGVDMATSPPGYMEAYGGDGDDFIYGIANGRNLLHGDAGDDFIQGGFNSHDTLYGGAGNDTLSAGNYYDFLSRQNIYSTVGVWMDGGPGDDALYGGQGNDTIYGGDGDDWIAGGRGNNRLYGGVGLDTYSLSLGNPTEIGSPFGDTLIFDTGGVIEFAPWMAADLDLSQLSRVGDDLIIGTLGRSSVTISDYYRNSTGWSTSGSEGHIDFARAASLPNQAIIGSERGDRIKGAGMADTLIGRAGNDMLFGDGFFAAYELDLARAIYRLYQATLDRAPDAGGQAGWTGQLATGANTLLGVAAGFVGSQELLRAYGGLDNEGFVTLLYQNVLDRAPDAGGLAGWVAALNDGQSRAQVVLGFSQSAEFINATNAAATDFTLARDPAFWQGDVFRLYQATLGREPDIGGFKGWAMNLANGTPFLTAVAGFVNSPEFQNIYGPLDNEAFVTTLYQNVLGRAPDALGLQGWTGLLAGGMSRAEVVRGFSQSGEFISATAPALRDWIRAQGVDDVLDGGAGTNELWGGLMADVFRFQQVDAGTHRVQDLEPWDYLDFRGFGFTAADDARAQMTQRGADVVFEDQGTTVILANTLLAALDPDVFLFA